MHEQHDFLLFETFLNLWWLGLFYLNAHVLVPEFLYHRRYVAYLALLSAALFLAALWDKSLFFLSGLRHSFSIRMLLHHNFIPFVFTVLVSLAYRTISDKSRSDIRMRDQESEHLKTELSFLRSQISPHFLFNVLNNMAAMARLKSAELEPTILKLASLMRYMLYETDEDKVVITSEAEYIRDYIDLQRQRFGEELILQSDFQILEPWQAVEPMLLIPLVENAFKHGAVPQQRPEIHIRLQVAQGGLDFQVRNRYEVSPGTKDKTSGIGLANVRRRLELLYPGRHRLELNGSGNWFSASLYIQFPL